MHSVARASCPCFESTDTGKMPVLQDRMNLLDHPSLRDLLSGTRSRADRYDVSGDWPAEDLEVLARVGAMLWAVPASCGGEALSPIELHYRYEAIAAASLTTALILTQRDSAVGIIASSENTALRDELLPKLAANEIFATVG